MSRPTNTDRINDNADAIASMQADLAAIVAAVTPVEPVEPAKPAKRTTRADRRAARNTDAGVAMVQHTFSRADLRQVAPPATPVEPAKPTKSAKPAKPTRAARRAARKPTATPTFGPMQVSDIGNLENFSATNPVVIADTLIVGTSTNDPSLLHLGIVKRNPSTGVVYVTRYAKVSAAQLTQLADSLTAVAAAL